MRRLSRTLAGWLLLGIAIATMTIVLNPERVVIGGGVAEAGDSILRPAREEPAHRLCVPLAGLNERAGFFRHEAA